MAPLFGLALKVAAKAATLATGNGCRRRPTTKSYTSDKALKLVFLAVERVMRRRFIEAIMGAKVLPLHDYSESEEKRADAELRSVDAPPLTDEQLVDQMAEEMDGAAFFSPHPPPPPWIQDLEEDKRRARIRRGSAQRRARVIGNAAAKKRPGRRRRKMKVEASSPPTAKDGGEQEDTAAAAAAVADQPEQMEEDASDLLPTEETIKRTVRELEKQMLEEMGDYDDDMAVEESSSSQATRPSADENAKSMPMMK
jgi:hypothetical protein